MRILVVSNYYPPHFIGGYELGCHEVVLALKARGHQVKVLTSTYQVNSLQDDDFASRRLGLAGLRRDEDFMARGRRLLPVEARNQKTFARLCTSFRPDVIYFWNMNGISISLLFAAARRRLPYCLYVSDHWLSQWQSDLWWEFARRWKSMELPLLSRLKRRVTRLRGLILPDGVPDMSHVQFCSQYLKEDAIQKGLPVQSAEVIHWGTNASLVDIDCSSVPHRLFFAGQIVPHKGPHIVVEALALLVKEGYTNLTLTFVGGSVLPEYEASVRSLVMERGLEDRCRFTGPLPRQELLPLYPQYDILVFPSSWEEPFAITPLEAMASGLAVVGTTTGGSGEIFQDGVNALTFPKEDAAACARQIRRLLDDQTLFHDIRKRGQQTVKERFGFSQMVDHIERSLQEAL